MLILALESSAKPASVAVVCKTGDNTEDGSLSFEQARKTMDGPMSYEKARKATDCSLSCRLLGQYFQNNGFSHSRTLLAMAQSLMSNLDIKVTDVDLIAVARGPGSFTGVRIGVSAVKGLAWGADIPVCGVSTLEAMAYQTPGPGVIICPVMDARRGQVYNALFEWKDDFPVRLTDDRAISLKELASELDDIGMPYRLIGDGAAIARDYLCRTKDKTGDGAPPYSGKFSPADDFVSARQRTVPCLIDTPELLRYQTAYGVALAALHAEPVPAVDLEPFYLRPSQAERELKGRQ